MTLLIVIVIVIVVVCVWLRIMGLKQAQIWSDRGPNEVRLVISKSFPGITWAAEGGPGDLNFRPRARAHAPTISITLAAGGGGTQVHIWTSSYTGFLGIFMGHGLLCWRKRAALVRRLQTTGAPTPGNLPGT
jgi:hypothetical protein